MTPIHDEQLAAVAVDLRAAISGEVRFDRESRVLYRTDASIYSIIRGEGGVARGRAARNTPSAPTF